ncbi:MAG: DUF222 domain-containing protein [Granulosicoccus sp.]
MADKITSNPPRERCNGLAFGVDSFNRKGQEPWGQSVRLAMACINAEPGVATGVPCSTGNRPTGLPSDKTAIAQRLKQLSHDIACNHADQIELLVRFDELEGWKESGAKHCVAWMNAELGISVQLGWERLRVGRELRRLPTLTALFRAGSLSWSKVRLLTRVASAENECLLCHASLDASVSDVQHLCHGYRWQTNEAGSTAADESAAENERAMQQYNARSLSWRQGNNGNTEIQLRLPVELAQGFLRSIEQCLEQLDSTSTTTNISQRRADAAVIMAERSLEHAGHEISTADRYQVVISVDADSLSSDDARADKTTVDRNTGLQPEKRPLVEGAEPIARESARRIACDASLVTLVTRQGELVDIGRKSRQWTAAMIRAIKTRDQHCQFPGCTANRHLQIHHIVHWADGGSTSVDNGVCLCSYHHVRLHEGGLQMQRVVDNIGFDNKQFEAQKATSHTFCTAERLLRNSLASFDAARSLLPTRYRFRVIDRKGNYLSGSNRQYAKNNNLDFVQIDSTHVESKQPAGSIIDYTRTRHKPDDRIVGSDDRVADNPECYRILERPPYNACIGQQVTSAA